MNPAETYMRLAIEEARRGMNENEGGPFGAVVVDAEGRVIGRGNNRVTSANDPTAHAEILAIREACQHLGHFQLTGCTLYSSCEPCPMCLGAIYWARPEKVFFACSQADAAAIDFDDQFIYKEIAAPLVERSIHTEQLLRHEALAVFREWEEKSDKIEY